MRLILVLTILTFWNCNSKKGDQGVNIGLRDKNGDTLSFSYFDSGNEDYEFYDSNGADSVFNNKKILSEMPGQFGFGVRNKKGKPFRFLIFGKADTAIIIGKNYIPQIPILTSEIDFSNCFTKVVDIRYDTTDKAIRENHLIASMDNITKDTILFMEENFFRVKKKQNNGTFAIHVVGGSFAIYDNKKTLKEMKDLCENAMNHALNAMSKKPK